MKEVLVFWHIPERDENGKGIILSDIARGSAVVEVPDDLVVPESYEKEYGYDWLALQKRSKDEILRRYLGDKWSEVFLKNKNEITEHVNNAEVRVKNLDAFNQSAGEGLGKLKDFSVNFYKEEYQHLTHVKVDGKIYRLTRTYVWDLIDIPQDEEITPEQK